MIAPSLKLQSYPLRVASNRKAVYISIEGSLAVDTQGLLKSPKLLKPILLGKTLILSHFPFLLIDA